MSDFRDVKKLRRTHRGRILAGVCSGLGEYLGVDANIIRIALVISSFFGGIGVGVYAVGWLLIPDENKENSILQDIIDKQRQRSESPWTQASDHATGSGYTPGYAQAPQPREPHDRPTTTEPADAADAPHAHTQGGSQRQQG
ncbi:PspC domain-containing protein [Thermostaphylospora chromogena]|nr:PspC domain-containing protein [Thermostaphylospora chromogena]